MTVEEQYAHPISVEDVIDYHPSRGNFPAKRVNYRLTDGTVSYTVIPTDAYTKEEVHKRLQEAADRHHDIMDVRVRHHEHAFTPRPDPFG